MKQVVLQISAGVMPGGATTVALDTYRNIKKHGFESKIATGGYIPPGKKYLKIPTKVFCNPKNLWEKLLFSMCKKTEPLIGKIKGAGLLTNTFYNLGRPSCLIKNIRGVENFENFPGTRDFFDKLDRLPDIVHCHNLQGGYFDLSILPYLSNKTNVVLTLHDEWTFTGHCSYSFNCTKWKTGCGQCPYLNTYPPLWRDTSAYNLKQKQNIYKNSKLHIITPSKWLMGQVKQSVLAPAIVSSNVIHNGIDLTIFKPAKRLDVRKKINLPLDRQIVLFIANQPKSNQFKDYKTLEKAIFHISEKKPTTKLLLLCVGEESETIQKNNCKIKFIKFLNSKEKLAEYYQAADIFVQATKKDNLPTTVLEALACGLPVIGTRVGGVVEQIHNYKANHQEPAGTLYELGNYTELAQEIDFILNNPELLKKMSQNARKDAAIRFGIETQIANYVNLYNVLLKQEIKNA